MRTGTAYETNHGHTSMHEPAGHFAQGTAFHAVDIIRAKCDGIELSAAQIDWIIAAYTAAEIADEQMAALAMAVLFRGLSRHELDSLDPGHDQLR